MNNQLKQVFDFIRCSEDMEQLKELVEKDPAYQSMEEDAFNVVVQYTAAQELVHVKEYYQEGEKVDMCKALTDLIAQGKAEGLEEGKLEGLKEGKLEGRVEELIVTCKEFGVSYEDTQARIRDRLAMSEENAKAYMDRYWDQ